jgi:ribosomal protein L29
LKDKEILEEINKASADLIRTRMEILNGYTKENHKYTDLKRYIALLKTVTKENEKSAATKK